MKLVCQIWERQATRNDKLDMETVYITARMKNTASRQTSFSLKRPKHRVADPRIFQSQQLSDVRVAIRRSKLNTML